MTFDPPPVAVLRPGTEPARLMETSAQIAALRDAGADEVIILEATRELLALTPEAFIRSVVDQYHPFAFVEGVDFRFGHNRVGGVDLLKTLGPDHGFETHVVHKVEVALNDQLLTPVSSSLIRWLLGHGRAGDAAKCLGRPYALAAPVIIGEKRGRTIGVPTVNLDPAPLRGRMIPADGVYSGAVTLPDGSTHPAAISVGVKPTFGQHQRTVEAHLLNFTGDLYGQTITVNFHHWLRDQQPFPTLDSLKAQITRDIGRVKKRMTKVEIEPRRHEGLRRG